MNLFYVFFFCVNKYNKRLIKFEKFVRCFYLKSNRVKYLIFNKIMNLLNIWEYMYYYEFCYYF